MTQANNGAVIFAIVATLRTRLGRDNVELEGKDMRYERPRWSTAFSPSFSVWTLHQESMTQAPLPYVVIRVVTSVRLMPSNSVEEFADDGQPPLGGRSFSLKSETDRYVDI